MLPQFELDVQAAAEEGRTIEALSMAKSAPHLSTVRREWLLATVLMSGSAQDKVEGLRRMKALIDHPWAKAEPETLALVALELSLHGLARNRKAEIETARGLAIGLEANHGDDMDTMQWVSRTWLNIGNRFLQDGKLDEAADAFNRVVTDGHPDNWCTRWSALCMLTQVEALRGEARPDLVEAAVSWIPENRQRAGFGDALTTLARAFVAYAQNEMGLARRLAEKAWRKGSASTSIFTQAYADLLLLRIVVETGQLADEALLARLGEWGDSLPFVPFLASKLLQGKEGTICVAAAVSR